MVVFQLRRAETGVPGENLSAQRREPTNSTHMMTPDLGIEPEPHWWEASALTTAPSLHPTLRWGSCLHAFLNQMGKVMRVHFVFE